MTNEFDFHPDDEVMADAAGIGYRVVLDLSDVDAGLIDEISQREGLQPTQALVAALREYAATRRPPHSNARAFRNPDGLRRLSVVLHQGATSSSDRRRVA